MKKHLVFISILLGAAVCTPSYAEQEVTKERQQLFEKIENNTESLEDLVDDRNWAESRKLANLIAGDVQLLKTLFPEDSKGDGRSKDRVWTDWHSFEGKLNNWSFHYEQVARASKNQDIALLKRAIDAASSTCRSCHMKYRSLW